MTQTELTINLLRQSTLNIRMSAWEYYNGPFDYSATPLGPLGCKIMIHNTSNTRKSWDQRGREGFSIGPALQQDLQSPLSINTGGSGPRFSKIYVGQPVGTNIINNWWLLML